MNKAYMHKCFYLPASKGDLFVSLYLPNTTDTNEVIMFIHPFGDELNKSRRMLSLQAKKFTEKGIAVFFMDLYGCGDSSGELRDVDWDLWLDDIFVCYKWVRNNVCKNIGLWGFRLGALLALDFSQNTNENISRILLWKPVISAEQFLNEFLRISLAGDMLTNSGKNKNKNDILQESVDGNLVELSGYELNPKLVQSMLIKNYKLFMRKDIQIIWIDIVRNMNIKNIAIENAHKYWSEIGVNYNFYLEKCEPFWSTVEITECTSLLNSTDKYLNSKINECN